MKQTYILWNESTNKHTFYKMSLRTNKYFTKHLWANIGNCLWVEFYKYAYMQNLFEKML